jgi:hypothetical protein
LFEPSQNNNMEDTEVDISGLDKVELIIRLWHATKVAGFYNMNPLVDPPSAPSRAEVLQALDKNESEYLDYFKGRPFKAGFKGDKVRTRLYNRDAGPDVFEGVVRKMRAEAAKTQPTAQASSLEAFWNQVD